MPNNEGFSFGKLLGRVAWRHRSNALSCRDGSKKKQDRKRRAGVDRK